MGLNTWEVEHIVRVHCSNGYIEVGTDPDTSSSVEIRTPEDSYFGQTTLTLAIGKDSKDFAIALADAIRSVAEKLP